MAVHAAAFTALVGGAGGGKSPVLKTMLSPLWELQKQANKDYDFLLKRYEEQLEKAKADGGDTPIEPKRHHYHSSNFTIEVAAKIQNDQEGLGFVLDTDELKGLFEGLGQYKGGKGNALEQILSGRDRVFQKHDRVGRETISFTPHYNIVGGIQRGVFEKMLGDFEDSNGQWARFWFCNIPKVRREFGTPEDEGIYEQLQAMLKSLYWQLRQFKPQTYRLSPAARKAYRAFHEQMEDRRLAEVRPAMEAIWSKAEKNVAEIALILHLTHYAHAGQTTAPLEVSLDIYKAAEETMLYFISQVLQVQSWGRAADGDIDPLLLDILKLAQRVHVANRDGVSPADCKRSLRSLRKANPEDIRGYLSQLADLGHGKIEGNGRRIRFIPKVSTVDAKVDKKLTAKSHDTQGIQRKKLTVDRFSTFSINSKYPTNREPRPSKELENGCSVLGEASTVNFNGSNVDIEPDSAVNFPSTKTSTVDACDEITASIILGSTTLEQIEACIDEYGRSVVAETIAANSAPELEQLLVAVGGGRHE